MARRPALAGLPGFLPRMMARRAFCLRQMAVSLLALSTLTPPHVAWAAAGRGRSEGAQQTAASRQPAEPQGPASTRLLFSKDVGAIFFPVRSAKCDAFESVMRRAVELLRASEDAVQRRLGDGCRLLKQHEPGRDNSAVYQLLLDPVVQDADYSPRTILGLARPDESERLQTDFASALAATPVQAEYELLMSMAPSSPEAPLPAGSRPATLPGAQAAAPPPAQRRVFTGAVGILFNFVKTERAADFEAVLTRLREAFGRSASQARQRQAAGWRVLRQAGNEPAGENVYLFLIDPVEKDADYSPARLLDEALGLNEAAELIKRYVPAFSRGVSLLNYSVILPAVKQ